MSDIKIHCNEERGQKFIKDIEQKQFLFSFVISYTETCEIPGITAAGADADFIKFTPAADAEFLHYGSCKSIDMIPMTPDGKPTPALLTKAALESASIPQVIINAGSKISPKLPYFQTGITPGKNIAIEPGLEQSNVMHAIDCGRILGRTLASCTDCLIIGESIPAGTTTALAVLKSLGIDAHVSSSMPKNPQLLKNGIVEKALKRSDSKEPYDVMSNAGDPMIPFVAGMLSTASEITNVILAGGTQMAAVLAIAKSTGYDENRVAIGTTSYIIDDKDANLLDMVKSISDIPILSINPRLEDSKFDGLRAYSKGFVKEGVGAGGSMIASILKTGIDSKKLLELIDKEYSRVTTSQ
jgi:uncharacterized protein (TIGR00303 family)